jgi:hypothetical protein
MSLRHCRKSCHVEDEASVSVPGGSIREACGRLLHPRRKRAVYLDHVCVLTNGPDTMGRLLEQGTDTCSIHAVANSEASVCIASLEMPLALLGLWSNSERRRFSIFTSPVNLPLLHCLFVTSTRIILVKLGS